MNGQKTATTGLGKGLAGILGEMVDVAPTLGVTDLLGAQRVRQSAAVREMVTETAISAIASAFGTDGVVIVRRDELGELATLASKIPSSWTGLDPLLFEISGQLWNLLEEGADGQIQVEVGGYSLLLCRQSSDDGSMAAAVVRKHPFIEIEIQTVGRLVRSVGSALHQPVLIPADNAIRVHSQDSTDGVLAEVRLGTADDRRHGAALAPDVATAIARAAAEICDLAFQVQFVGQTPIDGKTVTMVVLGDEGGGPLFGLSVTEEGDPTGPAEAVFGAARVISGDPFSTR